MKKNAFEFFPIGFLKSCFPDKFGVPRQSGLVKKTYSELRIAPAFQPELALQGIEGFSHLWLQFVFHRNQPGRRYHAKVHPPRLGGESVGVFATRSPHRPNPIGLSLVELCEVKRDTLVLAGADLIDGTPILDIKPYLSETESVPSAKSGWTSQLSAAPFPGLGSDSSGAIQIDFSDEANQKLQKWMKESSRSELKSVIVELLQQDPRPLVYRGFEGGEKEEVPYRQKHAMRLYEGDIHFEFGSKNCVTVFDIRF